MKHDEIIALLWILAHLTIPGPESISRREEKVAASLTADLLPAPDRPTRIIPRKLHPSAQHSPRDKKFMLFL
jgi:hypothetical protein